jgi:hypothetical protein
LREEDKRRKEEKKKAAEAAEKARDEQSDAWKRKGRKGGECRRKDLDKGGGGTKFEDIQKYSTWTIKKCML